MLVQKQLGSAKPMARGRTQLAPRAMHTQSTQQHRSSSPPPKARKPLNGPCVIRLEATSKFETPVQALPDNCLNAYMKDSPMYFTKIDMPMGGALRSLDLDQGIFEITIPRLQLFDLWLAPKARALVKAKEDTATKGTKVVIQGQECELHGSSHVKQFNLNERFNLDVAITFAVNPPRQEAPPPNKILTDGRIEVQVDIPPPFSFMPRPVLESTGNTALKATLAIVLNTFVSSLARDYARWAQERKQKAAVAAAAASGAAKSS